MLKFVISLRLSGSFCRENKLRAICFPNLCIKFYLYRMGVKYSKRF